MAENSCFEAAAAEDHEEQLQRDHHHRFHRYENQAYQQQKQSQPYQNQIHLQQNKKEKGKPIPPPPPHIISAPQGPSSSKSRTLCQQQFYKKDQYHYEQQDEDSGIGSLSERNNGERSYIFGSQANNAHSASKKFIFDQENTSPSNSPAIRLKKSFSSSARSSSTSSSSNNSSFSNANNNHHHHKLTYTPSYPSTQQLSNNKQSVNGRSGRGASVTAATRENNFKGRSQSIKERVGGGIEQHHQRLRSASIHHKSANSSSNCVKEGRNGSRSPPGQTTFLGRFRSQTNIANLSFPLKFSNSVSSNPHGSRSVMTSPVDISHDLHLHPPSSSSPTSLRSSTSNLAGGSEANYHHGGYSNRHHRSSSHHHKFNKPKKWFSFTNLLSRQNLTGFLNLPKSSSRLSVSTLNSVFVSPGSPSGESYPGSGGSSSGTYYNGYNNLSGEGEDSNSPGGGRLSSGSYFGGRANSDTGSTHQPPSPCPSSATVSGEFVAKPGAPNNPSSSPATQSQVVFRRKNNNGQCNGRSGSSSGTSSTATNFNIGGAACSSSVGARGGGGEGGGGNYSGNFSNNSVKHYSSGSCESPSERSSGIGYSSYNSTAGSTASIGLLHYASGGVGASTSAVASALGNRLSCGEFYTGGSQTSPVYSSGTPNSDFPFHFSLCSDQSSGQFENNGTNFVNSSGGGSERGGVASANYYNSRKALGRSLPALLEAMETGSSCPGSPENGYAQVSVGSVANLLYQEYVILTGAKSRSDHYLMIFPDRGNFHLLGDDDYKRLMIYLTSVPSMQDAELGFVLIIDRRNDKWNSVKTTLMRISSYFPGLIHRVFVLRPVGFIQKALSEVSTKLFRTENLKFRLTVCNSVSDLNAYVEPSQLLAELGGYLCYDKVKWVQQRTEVEAFYTALQSLSKDLKSFTESFQDIEYPNDVASTEELIQEKESIYERLKLDLIQSGEHGENLLKRIKHSDSLQSLNKSDGNRKQTGKASSSSLSSSSGAIKNGDALMKAGGNLVRTNSSTQLINVISVERFIIQIEETARLFEDFWMKEKHTLEQCLKLRRFEQDFRELQAIFDANTRILNDLSEMGENLDATDALIAETLSFELSTTDDISRALQVEQFGREIVDTNPSAVDTVEPKCAELGRVTSNFRSVIQDKISKQKEWREVQFTIEKANKICTEGMDLMTSVVPDCSEDSPDVGTSILSQIDSFLDKIQPILDELTNLKTNLKSPTSSQSKTLVKQVLKRVEDVQLMCAKRRSLVVQQITKSKSRRSSGSSLVSTPGSVSSTGTGANQNAGFPNELKSAKSTSQLDYSAEEYSSSSLRSGSSSLSLDGSSIHPRSANGKYEESWEMRRTKRGHVLNELLQTERTYVEEIGDVLHGYYGQIKNPSLKSLLPSQLQPIVTKTNEEKQSRNVSVLFCNLEEIHAFHEKLFLPDLSACIQSVELVGLCFIQRHAEFLSMYSQYCQLLPASENLRKDIREDHPWFLACRNRLGHKLPLGAYLLKPVQRITKYHLLLKDLVRNSEGCEGFNELVEALECMLVTLRCVNDGMHQLGITGYKGKLIDEGYLLQQGSFLLWTETKKDRLRIKGHERHLFLYQKSILICKKKASTYEFKDKLNMSEIGLTEALKGSGAAKKFEIWVNGRQKVYVLQAETQELKDLWVKEIKKLLLEQLESLRAIKSQGSNITPVSQNIITTNIPHTAAGKRQRMMGNKGITMNGWRNSHLPQHRPLRQVCSWDSGEPKRPKSRTMTTECEIDEEQWSSEISNSDEEESIAVGPNVPAAADSSVSVYGLGQIVEDPTKYLVLADYNAMGSAEISVKEGDIVSLVKVGCAGWWFVKTSNAAGDTLQEGWAPSAYLERMDNTLQKSPSLLIHRNSSSSGGTPPYNESILPSSKMETAYNRSKELEKITNDIVTALR